MKILVSFPTSPAHPFLHKSVVFVSWKLLGDKRHQVRPMIPTHQPFEHNLHKILNDFMASDCQFWLSIDADNPPLRNPLDLVELDLDIVGCPTPVWHFDPDTAKPGEPPLYYNAYDYVEAEEGYREHHPREGLQRVDAVGTGCILMHRRVFEDPYMRLAPFQRTWHSDGVVDVGNDLSFCKRARQRGFSIWAHYDYPCGHHIELDVNEMVAGFRHFYEGKANV